MVLKQLSKDIPIHFSGTLELDKEMLIYWGKSMPEHFPQKLNIIHRGEKTTPFGLSLCPKGS
jgi:hypothetical protein